MEMVRNGNKATSRSSDERKAFSMPSTVHQEEISFGCLLEYDHFILIHNHLFLVRLSFKGTEIYTIIPDEKNSINRIIAWNLAMIHVNNK